ncbi:MAG TPA: hypothetical protein VGH89_29790 [Pseudonocardia sp.]|jgi:hypothetical protein
MSRWITRDNMDEWAALFTGYAKSAYRLEGQQVYSSPTEDAAVARFVAGQPHGLDLSWIIPKLRAAVASGRTKTLVRVVTEPPTDYTRFELAVYPELVAEGQDIRIISVPDGTWPDDLPTHDYWQFDDQDVWRLHYHDDYTFRGAELLDGEETIAAHLRWRDIALAQAVPLQVYQDRRGDL